jgi:predicted transcriptional regulator of viral defense system
MLVRRDRIERVERSVYRVPQVPRTEHDRLQLALLWTGREDAALSHQTALDAWGVCDIYSDDVHVTIPPTARIRRAGGAGVVVHREAVPEADVTWWELMRIVTPAVAIQQCVGSGTQSHLIEQAVEGALSRSMINGEEAAELLASLERRHVEKR